MAILLVMLVLILGYYYSSNYLPERFKLKRSTGWESYVLLGSHGIKFVIGGTIFASIVWFVFYILSFCLNIPHYLGMDYNKFALEELLIQDISNDINIFHIMIAFGSWNICQQEIKKRKINVNLLYQEMSNANNIVNLLLSAMSSQTPVKVSLKSKKVYIGIIDGTQFSSADLENIVIIPYLSGYRDKDKLDITFDCNYRSVYEKHNISYHSDREEVNLRYFRNVIRLAEVESISLFNFNYFGDFEYLKTEDKKNDITK
ncbi:hypothetical protein E4T80_11435 [Muribacter muris]|uniref:Uncharacterized protein n=1 Tax=Muribacter muris TaxID=67855 RepID=A0A4Y9JQ87_9PAST|nr:hypothetical protein [Muribacter muris]MBF0786076.1 hypothetical protein [Muribacter muris]MBF0827178.1 hypothetical protein [Muribacter muris]TFV07963.1 hypothetical protein E4T80_11435 [Muribacter muris]